jgi:uncharacterized cupredoxin-like copper-binding protein
MRTLKTAAAAATLLAAVGTATALAHSSMSTATVKAKEVEWAITPTPKTAKHGKITFVVTNKGKLPHEFLVVRSNKAPGKLPVKGTKAVLKGIPVVGKLATFKPGATKKLTVTLKAGKYILLCNIAAHYKAGQYGGFKAT